MKNVSNIWQFQQKYEDYFSIDFLYRDNLLIFSAAEIS